MTLFFIRYFLHLHFKCYPQAPYTLPHPAPQPTHSPFLTLAFPCTEAYKVCNTKGPLFPSDSWLGHLLLHMQLETQALGVLVSSNGCFTYTVADPFSSLGAFSSFSIGGPVFHPIDDCDQLHFLEHYSVSLFCFVCFWFVFCCCSCSSSCRKFYPDSLKFCLTSCAH